MQVDLTSDKHNPEQLNLGRGRPPLVVRELPGPESVFHLRRIGWEEFLLFISGPAFITLALSLGGSLWLIAPLTVSSTGLQGIGWLLLAAVLLQVAYNIELGRYTLATGESPLVGFGRFPPGPAFWLPLALVLLTVALVWGSGAFAAAEMMFTLVNNRPPTAVEVNLVRMLAVGLLASAGLLLSFGRRLSRTLEIASWVVVTTILISLTSVTFVVVPGEFTRTTLGSLLSVSRPQFLDDPLQTGALLGLAALASGLNFMVISHYRDKGYGMGSLTGALSGLFGGLKGELSPTGFVFTESQDSTARWKQWFRYLLLDQGLIYLPGLLVGIFVPVVLFHFVFTQAGNVSYYDQNIFIALAEHLLSQYGSLLSTWILVIGFALLFIGQVLILEALTRSLTEGLYCSSAKVRQATRSDPRRLYYPLLLLAIVVIGALVFVIGPGQQVLLAGNIANLAAAIFPLILLYLNFRLPKPARATWVSAVVLLANIFFFGLLFINFAASWLTGQALFAF